MWLPHDRPALLHIDQERVSLKGGSGCSDEERTFSYRRHQSQPLEALRDSSWSIWTLAQRFMPEGPSDPNKLRTCSLGVRTTARPTTGKIVFSKVDRSSEGAIVGGVHPHLVLNDPVQGRFACLGKDDRLEGSPISFDGVMGCMLAQG